MFNSLYIEPEDGKEEEMFQVAGNCPYIERWNCMDKRLKMQLFHEAGYIVHINDVCWGGFLHKPSNNWLEVGLLFLLITWCMLGDIKNRLYEESGHSSVDKIRELWKVRSE